MFGKPELYLYLLPLPVNEFLDKIKLTCSTCSMVDAKLEIMHFVSQLCYREQKYERAQHPQRVTHVTQTTL